MGRPLLSSAPLLVTSSQFTILLHLRSKMVKKTTTTATSTPPPPSSGIADDLVFINDQQEEANEFSFWEFINQSDADSDTESLHSIENGFVSWFTLPPPPRPRSSNSDGEIESQAAVDGGDAVGDANFIAMRVDDFEGEGEEEGNNESEEEEEDDDGGYGLDDELVPWNVAGKFGRGRMRKLGKRFCSKMVYAKHNRCAYVKPGCVHGKHGLGMKA